MKKSTHTSSSLPLIRPEDNTDPLFKLLNDYYEKIHSRYDQKEQKTLQKMDRLEEKLSVLLSILQFLFLLVVYAHPMQYDQKTPSKIKKQMQTVSGFILSLDRDRYRGFLKKISNQIEKLRRKAVQLNMKIVQDIDRLEQQKQQQKQQRVPPLLFQSSPRLEINPSDPNNRLQQYLVPPALRRQTTRSYGFQF